MSKLTTLLAGTALLAAATVGATAYSGSTSNDESATAQLDPYRCEIRATSSGGALMLEPVIVSDRDVQGTFMMHVRGSGNGNSSNMRQGGGFVVDADEETVLGRMRLGSPGMVFDVSLNVDSPLGQLSCEERISGSA